MDSVKKSLPKKKLISDILIISIYMESVLKNNSAPKSVSVFCKENKINESDFYTFFGSLGVIRQEIWMQFFENTLVTIKKESNFETYTDKNKLLTLYYTLFEILTLNRSYVLFSLKENKEGLKNLKDLKQFRNHFKDFISTIIQANTSEINDKVMKLTKPIYSEGAWIQFLFLLKFWMEDSSKGFEKTDILIEKSVNTVVDLLDTKPLESLFDLGKFLWKEKRN